MKKFLFILSLTFVTLNAHADNYQWGRTLNGAGLTTNEATVSISSTGVTGSAVTLTISSSTAISNLGGNTPFIYLTDIHMEMYAAGTLTGGATPVTCTTTNLPGSPVFKFPTAAAIGTVTFYNIDYVFPLRASASNAAVTVVCPATTNVIWNLQTNNYYDN